MKGNYCREGSRAGRVEGRGLARQTQGVPEVKLAEAVSLVSACDKELANLKETMKTYEQVF